MSNHCVTPEEARRYDTFESYCKNAYCCNKNPWSDLDDNCKECEEAYYRYKAAQAGEGGKDG